MNKPVITIENIYPLTNGWNSVLFTKIIEAGEAVQSKSLLSLSNRGMGDDKVIQDKDRKLTVFKTFTTESLNHFGLKIGVDINTVGIPYVYDIVERYTPTLSKEDFDENGNVQVEPVINIKTGEVQIYSGKIMFRTTEFVEAETVEGLPKSDAKPTRTGYIEDVFEGEKNVTDPATGKKRKTPQFQAYLNTLYATYSVPSSTIPLSAIGGSLLASAQQDAPFALAQN